MNKSGAMKLRAENERECCLRATRYLAKLPTNDAYHIVKYRSGCIHSFGVVVNVGDTVTLWDGYKETFIRMSESEYKNCNPVRC